MLSFYRTEAAGISPRTSTAARSIRRGLLETARARNRQRRSCEARLASARTGNGIRCRDDAALVAPPRPAVSGGSSNFPAANRSLCRGRQMLDDIAAPHTRSAPSLKTVAYLTRNWQFESISLQERVKRTSNSRPAWPTAISLSLWFLWRAQNATYHGSGYSKGAGDVPSLHSRPERRANEICCSLGNLLNPFDLVIADGRRLAL